MMYSPQLLSSNRPLPRCEPMLLRERCFKLLDAGFSRPLICLSGGQGFGKSVLALSYVAERRIPFVRIQFNKGMEQHSVFLDTVGRGLNVAPDEIEVLSALANWREPLAVILDFENDTEADSNLLDVILQLIQHCSESVTFLLLGRIRSKLPMVKLKAQARAAELKPEELRFQPDEIADFFALFQIVLEEQSRLEIFRYTGGWAMCLPYLAEIWTEAGISGSVPAGWTHPLLDELLDATLPEEIIFMAAAGTRLEDLLPMSVLHELKSELRMFLPAGLMEAQWEVIASSFLLQRNEDFTYRLNPLVRGYLYRRLRMTKGQQAVAELHLKAAEIYENLSQYYYAFAHRLAAEDYREAARLMLLMMNFYTPERFLLLLDGTLETIGPSISFSTFTLFLFRCIPVSVLQSYVPDLEGALQKLQQGGLSASLLYLQHRLGLMHFYCGEVQRAKRLFADSLFSSEQLGNRAFIIINLSLLAQCCLFTKEFSEGVVYAREALSGIESLGSYDAHMHTVWILTELLLEQGSLALVEPILDELMRLGEQHPDEAARIYPLISKAKFLRMIGEADLALTHAEQAFAQAEPHRLKPDLGWICLEIGRIQRSRSESDHAARYFEQAALHFREYPHFMELIRDVLPESVVTITSKASVTDAVEGASTEGDPGPDKLEIRLLGPLSIRCGGAKELKLQRKSSLQLLLYLAAHYNRKVPKDQLLEVLFPDGGYTSQNNRFYVALSALRKALEPGLASGRKSSYIIQIGELFSLNLARCTLDLAEFEEMANMGDLPSEARLAHLLQAEKLYADDLLAEYPYETFLEPVRERVKHAYLHVLREIALIYWGQRLYQQGMLYYQRVLEKDSFSESVYWEYLKLLLEHGFLQNAKQTARLMIRNLEQELGVPIKERLREQFPNLGL